MSSDAEKTDLNIDPIDDDRDDGSRLVVTEDKSAEKAEDSQQLTDRRVSSRHGVVVAEVLR